MAEQITIDKLLTLMQAEYPTSFSGLDERMMALKKQLWKAEFENDDLNMVYAAFRLYARDNEKFAPTIGQIRSKMAFLSQLSSKDDELTEQKAWAMVSKACRNGIYGYRTEFEKLPPIVQRTVGTPEQIQTWALMDAETLESVVASNFMRSFRTVQTREKEIAALPPSMRDFISAVAVNMKMIGE